MTHPIRCAHHVYVLTPAEIEDGERRRCRECGWRERAVTLPYVPPGTNSLHGHRHETTKWRGQVKGDVMRLAPRLDPLEYAVVHVDLYWSDHRRRDVDNYLAGLKGALDALVERGWLVDDDAAHMELGHVRGHLGADRSCVVISVEERT